MQEVPGCSNSRAVMPEPIRTSGVLPQVGGRPAWVVISWVPGGCLYRLRPRCLGVDRAPLGAFDAATTSFLRGCFFRERLLAPVGAGRTLDVPPGTRCLSKDRRRPASTDVNTHRDSTRWCWWCEPAARRPLMSPSRLSSRLDRGPWGALVSRTATEVADRPSCRVLGLGSCVARMCS